MLMLFLSLYTILDLYFSKVKFVTLNVITVKVFINYGCMGCVSLISELFLVFVLHSDYIML